METNAKVLAVVGAVARIEPGSQEGVKSFLDAMEGVETFDLDDPDRIGIVIEADGAKMAQQILDGPVRSAPGVWGTWPVSIELEDHPDRVVEDGVRR